MGNRCCSDRKDPFGIDAWFESPEAGSSEQGMSVKEKTMVLKKHRNKTKKKHRSDSASQSGDECLTSDGAAAESGEAKSSVLQSTGSQRHSLDESITSESTTAGSGESHASSEDEPFPVEEASQDDHRAVERCRTLSLSIHDEEDVHVEPACDESPAGIWRGDWASVQHEAQSHDVESVQDEKATEELTSTTIRPTRQASPVAPSRLPTHHAESPLREGSIPRSRGAEKSRRNTIQAISDTALQGNGDKPWLRSGSPPIADTADVPKANRRNTIGMFERANERQASLRRQMLSARQGGQPRNPRDSRSPPAHAPSYRNGSPCPPAMDA